jgi:hypothetical protein
MKNFYRFTLFLLLHCCCFNNAQSKIEADIDVAYQNAKKGIYWALENIPEKKSKLENDLIADDKLYATVKLEREVNGIKVESTGYNLSNLVVIRIYKSYDSLVKEGYLKKIPLD